MCLRGEWSTINLSGMERAVKWQRAREMRISKRGRKKEREQEGELMESAEASLTQGLYCIVRLPSYVRYD